MSEQRKIEQAPGCGLCRNGYIEWGTPMSVDGLHSKPCKNPACSALRIAYVKREGASATIGVYR